MRRLAATLAAVLTAVILTGPSPSRAPTDVAALDLPRAPRTLLETTTTTTRPTTTTTPPAPSTTVSPGPAAPDRPRVAVTAAGPPPSPCGGIDDALAAHFPPEAVPEACSVIRCETGGTFDPTIENPSSSASGLFQFLDSTWTNTTGRPPPASAYTADEQIAAGAALWRTSGWAPWSCKP